MDTRVRPGGDSDRFALELDDATLALRARPSRNAKRSPAFFDCVDRVRDGLFDAEVAPPHAEPVEAY